LADTLDPVVAERPVDGLQSYVAAPDAVSVAATPLQAAGLVGDTVMVGFGFTVTVVVAVLVHPLASVPVTV
jgi:hypothetical protein